MKRIYIVIVLSCEFSYIWGAMQHPQPEDNVILRTKIEIVGTPVDFSVHTKIVWDMQSTFAEHELVAIKSHDGSLRYGLVESKAYRWFIWTEKNQEGVSNGKAFELEDIEKLPEKYKLSSNVVGELVNKKLKLFIECDPWTTYKKGEIVAIRRSDKTVRFGCVEKAVSIKNRWFVLCDTTNSKGDIFIQKLRPEYIGKFFDFD